MKKLIVALATGFYLGYLPYLPGTAGSLGGLFIYLFLAKLSLFIYLLLTLGLFLSGILICDKAEVILEEEDSPKIIVDEIVGYLVAALGLPKGYRSMLLSFMFFRLFDIWKPYPVSKAHRLKGGVGVMSDDLLAGLMSNLILKIYSVMRLS